MSVHPIIESKSVDEAMNAFVRECGNPTTLDAYEALLQGFIRLGSGQTRYACTDKGREWLVKNALAHGANFGEARTSLDYIDGAY